jgi:hypothetical protein
LDGYSSEDKLVNYDAKGEEVGFEGVVHSADDFWGHVARGSACLLGVVLFTFTGHSEVGDSGIAVLLEDNVLGL